jgi:hypothetical protein
VRVLVGQRPPRGQAAGVYGGSRLLAVGLGVWAAWFGFGLVFDPPKAATRWELALAWAIFVLIGAMAAAALFLPALTVDESGFKRRWSARVPWREVNEVLPARPSGRGGVRLRLDDRAVVELRQLDESRRESLLALVGVDHAA